MKMLVQFIKKEYPEGYITFDFETCKYGSMQHSDDHGILTTDVQAIRRQFEYNNKVEPYKVSVKDRKICNLISQINTYTNNTVGALKDLIKDTYIIIWNNNWYTRLSNPEAKELLYKILNK